MHSGSIIKQTISYTSIEHKLIQIGNIDGIYRQFSNLRLTQSQNINVSRLVLQLSLPDSLKPDVKLRMM